MGFSEQMCYIPIRSIEALSGGPPPSINAHDCEVATGEDRVRALYILDCAAPYQDDMDLTSLPLYPSFLYGTASHKDVGWGEGDGRMVCPSLVGMGQ